jgi:hypothetical protein
MVGANLAIDFHGDGYRGGDGVERAELAATTAASLAAFILEHKQQVGILSNGIDAIDRMNLAPEEGEAGTRSEARRRASLRMESDRLQPVELPLGRGTPQLRQVRHVLARLELASGLSLAEILFQEYPRLPRDAALVVIAPRVPPALVSVLAELKRSGFVPSVFLLAHDADWDRAARTLSVHHIPCYHVTDESQLANVAGVRL